MESQKVALLDDDALENGSYGDKSSLDLIVDHEDDLVDAFCWAEYVCFFVLGIGMMWTWNAVIAAAPYFELRLDSNAWILKHYESAMFATFASGLLGTTVVLLLKRGNPQYTFRIHASLSVYAATSIVLALSTIFLTKVEPLVYFCFLLTAAGSIGIGNGLSQNGGYSFVAGYGQPRYTQAVLLGCATSGIIPPIVQIGLVLGNTDKEDFGLSAASRSTIPRIWPFALFSLCAIVALAVMCTVKLLVRRREAAREVRTGSNDEKTYLKPPTDAKETLDHATFFRTSYHQALAICLCFIVTTCSPVFSSKVHSTHSQAPLDWRNEQLIFVPLAYLIWQFSDFVGSFIPLIPLPAITNPWVVLSGSVARFGFLAVYNLCNIDGRGALVGGDLFYLVCVQALSGLTNGWLSIACMTSSSFGENKGLRERAGAFMSFYLIAGLATGSLLSFAVA